MPSSLGHAAAALLAALACAAAPVASAAPDLNETARVLAGLQAPAPGPGEPGPSKWQSYLRESSNAWSGYERRTGAPIREWARAELERTPGETVFYPFSGPDFPTVHHLYPDAGRYVLVAIQPAGPPPALDQYSPEERDAFFALFRRAWGQFAHIGFFRTDDLDADARTAGIRVGVTAPLMAFAARVGYEIAAVEPVRVNAQGTALEPHPGSRDDAATWDSVRLRLAKDGRETLLDYVRLDLSDRGLRGNVAGAAWIERMAAHRAVLKAASHLPQRRRFSMIRDALLRHSPSIWQDETGIDYAALAGSFSVTLYGAFTRPHHRFAADSQNSLASAYRAARSIAPLPFTVGYRKEAGSSVQVAVRTARARGVAAAKAVESPAGRQPGRADNEAVKLQARIAAQLAEYARRPRKLFLGGSPVEPAQAGYVASVRSHVARLLREAGLAAGPGAVLSLTLDHDGALRAADLERSSGSSALDARVRALVRDGAPFPRWPDTLRAGADLMVVTLHLPGS